MKTELTPREIEVVLYASNGFRDKEIADRMGQTVRQIDRRWRAIRGKLGATTKPQAIRLAVGYWFKQGGNPPLVGN